MKLTFENLYLLNNKEKVQIIDFNNSIANFNLSYDSGYYVRKNIIDRVYFCLSAKDLIFSNSLKLLTENKNRTLLSKEIIENFREIGFIPSPYTIFANIYSLPYYSGIKINKNIFEIKRFFPNKNTPFLNQNDFENYMNKIILKDVSKKNYLLFRGGSDSLFIFYNLLAKHENSFINIIVKMKGMENDFLIAKKISDYYKIKVKTFDNFSSNFNNNINLYIDKQFEPVQDPIVPAYYQIINENLVSGDEVFFDGQGADSLLMGLPHNLLINLYNPYFSKIFKIISFLFKLELMPNSKIKRLYYRTGKVVKSLSQKDWISCFLCSLNIMKNNHLFEELSDCLNDFYKYFKCKHKSISFFFMVIILDSREMQKYRSLKLNTKVSLPFLKKNLIEKVFSTPSSFFIKSIYKKIPIYKFVNKKKFKISSFKTNPFFIEYSENKNIFEYSYFELIKQFNSNIK